MTGQQGAWRAIPRYPEYEVSADGRVRNTLTGAEVKQSTARDGGYKKVALRDAIGNTVLGPVHRLVAHTFHGPPPSPRALVRHLDHDPTNNSASNLVWGTHKENARDRLERGTVRRGSAIASSVLSDALVEEIRRQYLAGATASYLARRYGVTQSNIYAITSGKTWTHVGGPNAPDERKRKKGVKLTEDIVREIRAMAASGVPQSTIAARFGISQAGVSSIVTRKRWTQVH